MKNKLQYLGFLGFLGLLGFFTDNTGFFGFFGFLGFFAFKKIIPDERFKENVGNAAKNAFIVSIVFFALASTFASLVPITDIYVMAFALNFGIQILVFTFSLQYYER
ncbi:MAG: DUF3796 domain-containing protein [Firmicutes bacterium]|nr:DUF3796 domain-containing protein [Bacillota bacterium]